MIYEYLSKFGSATSEHERAPNVKQLAFRYLGLYFTAEWCGSCVRSSSSLKKIINKINEVHPGMFKMITIRLDEGNSNFGYDYWRLPQISYQQAGQISKALSVKFLPSILIFNKSGKLVSRQGFQDLFKHKQKSVEYWDSINS